MNNRGFQQHQNNMRRNQQATDQSRRTHENMQRQQAMVQQGRENSRRLQHGASLSPSKYAVQHSKRASSPGCGLRLAWIVRSTFAGSIMLGILGIFLTGGADTLQARELALQLAMVGAVFGFCVGVFRASS